MSIDTTTTSNEVAILDAETLEVVSSRQEKEISEQEALQRVSGFDFDDLGEMEESIELTAQVKDDWTEGEVSKVIFVMNKTLTKSGATFPAVMLTDGKKSYLLAAIMAVQAIKDLAPGTPLAITFVGTKPAAKGKQSIFKVAVLRSKKHAPVAELEILNETTTNGVDVEVKKAEGKKAEGKNTK